MRSLHANSKITRHSATVAAGTTTITPSGAIDMAGFNGCIFIASFGVITASAVTSIEIHQSATSGGSYNAIIGTKVVIDDDEDAGIVYVDIHFPTKQFLKCIVKRATANAVLEGIVAVQYGARDVADDATVRDGELHVGAIEGTA